MQTPSDLSAQLDAIRAQLNALQVQFAALPSGAGLHALIADALREALPRAEAPSLAAEASALAQVTAAARRCNAHDRDGKAYVVVPRADGTAPPNWPAGFAREHLVGGALTTVNALLADYGLRQGLADESELRNALASHLGTMRA